MVARCRVSGQGIQPPTPCTGTRPPFHPAGVVPRFPVPVLFRVFRNACPAPVAGGVPAPGNPSPGARCLSGTLPGKNNGCSRCRVPRPGFLPRPGCLRSVSYAPCPRPPVVSVPGLGGAPPGRFPGTLPGCEPGGVPVLSNCTGRKEPGNPEPVHPAVIILSAGVDEFQDAAFFLFLRFFGRRFRHNRGRRGAVGRRNGHFRGRGFRFRCYHRNLCTRPGFPSNLLPPLFPVDTPPRFATVPGGTCSRVVSVAFLLNCQCSPGCSVTLRFVRVPRPGLPRGRFRCIGHRKPCTPGTRFPGVSGVAPRHK